MIVFVVHVLLGRIVVLPQASGRYELLLGVAYFVFGLFAAFAIENARNGLARVNELLKAGDAVLVVASERRKQVEELVRQRVCAGGTGREPVASRVSGVAFGQWGAARGCRPPNRARSRHPDCTWRVLTLDPRRRARETRRHGQRDRTHGGRK